MSEERPKPVRPLPETIPTLIDAWIGTKMEADRTLVALSAGGIGLLVGLLVTVSEALGPLLAYWLALAAFLLAITVGIVVFRLNGRLIEKSLTDLNAAENSRTKTALTICSWALIILFGTGVLLSAWVGYRAASIHRPANSPPPAEGTR